MVIVTVPSESTVIVTLNRQIISVTSFRSRLPGARNTGLSAF
jgi:hypothetical protein